MSNTGSTTFSGQLGGFHKWRHAEKDEDLYNVCDDMNLGGVNKLTNFCRKDRGRLIFIWHHLWLALGDKIIHSQRPKLFYIILKWNIIQHFCSTQKITQMYDSKFASLQFLILTFFFVEHIFTIFFLPKHALTLQLIFKCWYQIETYLMVVSVVWEVLNKQFDSVLLQIRLNNGHIHVLKMFIFYIKQKIEY